MSALIQPGKYDLEGGVHKITDYRCVSRDMQHVSLKPRLYLHLDMNCYYAQVEQMCYNLYGMPVYIGGWYKANGTPRGIVATCSYEARTLGVRTGMSAFEAERLCPYIIGLQAHYEKYKGISREIETVLKDFACDVEKYSMDEYFLDITFLKDKSYGAIRNYGHTLARHIADETNLRCSIGISYSKTYAKLASDLQKPNGLTLILDENEARNRIWPLPLNEVWGIGRRRFVRLQKQGLETIKDGINRGYVIFQREFGAYFGKLMYEMIAGKDRAKVLTPEIVVPEQLNYMHTFSDQTRDADKTESEILKGVAQLCYRMRGYNVRSERYYAYLRIQDAGHKGMSFMFNTEGKTNLDDYVFYECIKTARPLIKKILDQGDALRGIGIGTLDLAQSDQLELFFTEEPQRREFYLAQDAVNNKFGKMTLYKAAQLCDVGGKTHFLERS